MRVRATAFSLKRLVYIIAVTCAAFFTQHVFLNDQNYWVIWSALVLSLITLGETFTSRLIIMLLTGVAAGLAAFLASCFAPVFPVLAIYLFLITMGCMLLSQFYPNYFLPLFVINLFALLASGVAATSLTLALERWLFILLGFAIAIVLQIVGWFHFVLDEWRWFTIDALKQLKILNNEIFSCFLQPDYPDNIYLYEHRLHLRKNKCMQAITRLFTLPKDKQQEKLPHNTIDRFFDLLLDCSQLRRRVSDHTTFAICNPELTTICQEIDRLFEGLIALVTGEKTFFPEVSMLQNKIQQLEENYNHVLQVASREPLAFVLFIFSLRALSSEMVDCYEMMMRHVKPSQTITR